MHHVSLLIQLVCCHETMHHVSLVSELDPKPQTTHIYIKRTHSTLPWQCIVCEVGNYDFT